MVFSGAHPGAPACTLTEVGCKHSLTKSGKRGREKVLVLFGAHFYGVLANTWLEIAGFAPLSKHGLDLGPSSVLIVCLYKLRCLQRLRLVFPLCDRLF